MGSDGDPSAADDDPPKKKGLDISLILRPITDVQTSAGRIFLYPPRVSDFKSFEQLSSVEPADRFREFLPCVASLSATSEIETEREPLAQDLAAQLSDEDVEALADAYASSAALQAARVGSKDRSGLPREAGEATTSYVNRLIKKELEDHVESMRRMHEKVVASTSGLFDAVRKSSALLGSTLTDFDRLSRSISTPVMPVIETKSLELSNHITEQHARLARERAEELEMVRLTGKMTAQSAKTLQDLAEAASTLLENMDERDQRSNRMTHIQLWIAVGSVVVAAFLSGAAFIQDNINNAANDKWQEKVLSSINEGNLQHTSIEEENKRLRVRINELGETVARLSAAKSQPAVPETKSADSATRRATSPGKTRPPP